MELIVVIKRKEETQSVGSNGFELQNVHVVTEEQHAQTLELKFTQGRIIELEKVNVGDRAKISVNLKGREIQKDGKPIVFNTIEGWKVVKL
jgi:hypothetical protein